MLLFSHGFFIIEKVQCGYDLLQQVILMTASMTLEATVDLEAATPEALATVVLEEGVVVITGTAAWEAVWAT